MVWCAKGVASHLPSANRGSISLTTNSKHRGKLKTMKRTRNKHACFERRALTSHRFKAICLPPQGLGVRYRTPMVPSCVEEINPPAQLLVQEPMWACFFFLRAPFLPCFEGKCQFWGPCFDTCCVYVCLYRIPCCPHLRPFTFPKFVARHLGTKLKLQISATLVEHRCSYCSART